MGSTTTLADTWNAAKPKGVFKTMRKAKSELSPKLNLFFYWYILAKKGNSKFRSEVILEIFNRQDWGKYSSKSRVR